MPHLWLHPQSIYFISLQMCGRSYNVIWRSPKLRCFPLELFPTLYRYLEKICHVWHVDRRRCCQSLIHDRPSPVYHTERTHLCTTRWARCAACRAGSSATANSQWRWTLTHDLDPYELDLVRVKVNRHANLPSIYIKGHFVRKLLSKQIRTNTR